MSDDQPKSKEVGRKERNKKKPGNKRPGKRAKEGKRDDMDERRG